MNVNFINLLKGYNITYKIKLSQNDIDRIKEIIYPLIKLT
jgi:hypothetical protein